MAKVLVTRRLPAGGTDPLLDAGHDLLGPGTDPAGDDTPMTPTELVAAAGAVDAIVCLLTDRIDTAVLEAGAPVNGGSLRVVANVAVGYDNVDVARADELGITVCNTPGVLDETTADLAFALILAASRRMSVAETDLRAGTWPGWGINQYLGQDVHGATLGIVGYGRIGRAVARRATGFGMNVLHHSRRATGEGGFVADLDELLDVADVVSLHVPLTEATHHLIDARRLERMRPNAVLVNTARGPVVDEAALAAALTAGTILAAGIDVYEHEPAVHPALLTAPNVVLLPHVGSASVATRTRMARLACEGVNAVLRGETPPNRVEP